jgi:phytoene/squalene synthetase
MRDPVGLAYLLARAADTIADTSLIPPEKRMELLLSLRSQVNICHIVMGRVIYTFWSPHSGWAQCTRHPVK